MVQPIVKSATLVCVAALLSTTMACSEGVPPPPLSPSATLVNVSVTGTTPAVGGRSQFTANAIFSDGHAQNVTSQAVWMSSAPATASVVAGLVTAVAPGDATITASYQELRGSANIAIPVPPDGTITPFMRDYIEALFLGTGPLTPTDGVIGCPRSFGRWLGFPAGTTVQLIVSSAVPSFGASALSSAAGQVPEASANALTVIVSSTADVNPVPAVNQVTATMHGDPISLGCGFPQGCTRFTFGPDPSQIVSARAILVTGQAAAAYVHDAIGHGVMGLCHVDGNLIGGARQSLMSYGPGVFSNQLPLQLSSFDLIATRAVFSSGLTPGATRDDFLRMGLVNPVTGATRPAPAASVGTDGEIPAPRIR
jgi:Big-like domain-containing protein